MRSEIRDETLNATSKFSLYAEAQDQYSELHKVSRIQVHVKWFSIFPSVDINEWFILKISMFKEAEGLY